MAAWPLCTLRQACGRLLAQPVNATCTPSIEPDRIRKEAALEGARYFRPALGGSDGAVDQIGDGAGAGEEHHQIEGLRLVEEFLEIDALLEAPVRDQRAAFEDRFGLVQRLTPGGELALVDAGAERRV